MGLYFAVLIARGAVTYVRFRRVRKTALVAWRVPRPHNFGLLLSLGGILAFVTLLNGYMARPWAHVASLALMASYFIVMVPLSTLIEWGCYADGVWADAGFLRYADIRQMAFREVGAIVLVLLPRRGSGPFRMLVPPSEYGAVRRIFEEKARAQELRLERLLAL
jgi:hypothetical protein